jgi:diaminopropionate ammonia-lyase
MTQNANPHPPIANPAWEQRTPLAVELAGQRPRDFHRTLPGYRPTPLVRLRAVSNATGVAQVVVKHESERLGLPAYKILGASWALHQAVVQRAGLARDRIHSLDALRAQLTALGAVTLCTATDGNHGRGVAALAEWLGVDARVFVPADTVGARVDAIRSHGAQVTRVEGSYDDAVAQAAACARQFGCWLCADTVSAAPSGEAADDLPVAGEHPIGAIDADGRIFATHVQEGYATLVDELVEQLGHAPDILLVQAGVGALAAGAIAALHRWGAATRIVTVEPLGSACIYESLVAGTPTPVADTFTIMAGLRAQQVSETAWPLLRMGVAAAVVATDREAEHAMRTMAAAGLVAGESGAAGLAGWLQLSQDHALRHALGITSASTIALINTEGATDAARYQAIVGDSAETVAARKLGDDAHD